MPRIVWILPVGLEYDRVLESLKAGGREFHILYSGTDDGVSLGSQKFAKRIYDYLDSGPFVVKSYRGLDVLDIGACIIALKQIVEQELRESPEVLFRINVGTSSKVMTIASFYVAAQQPQLFELWYPRAKEYLVTEIVDAAQRVAVAHKGGEAQGHLLDDLADLVDAYNRSGSTTRRERGYEMMVVPIIPIQHLSRTQEAILRALLETPEPFGSGAKLAEFLFEREGELGAKHLEGAKSTVSFGLRSLIEDRLVEVESVGNRKQIRLTESGRLYCQVFLIGADQTEQMADLVQSKIRRRSKTAPDN